LFPKTRIVLVTKPTQVLMDLLQIILLKVEELQQNFETKVQLVTHTAPAALRTTLKSMSENKCL